MTNALTHASPLVHASSAAATRAIRQHTAERFSFLVDAPIADLFPLFGAEGERAWAPDWEPEFLWPAPARDELGMVFTVEHGADKAVWVNTAFDRAAGRVQYVYVLPKVVATVITLTLEPNNAMTRVSVNYDRTSLSPEADEVVAAMAVRDRTAGEEWSRLIDAHLRASLRDRQL